MKNSKYKESFIFREENKNSIFNEKNYLKWKFKIIIFIGIII